MKQNPGPPTRSTPAEFQESANHAPAPVSSGGETAQDKTDKDLQFLYQDPIIIHPSGDMDEEPSSIHREFWMSFLAHAIWVVPVVFLCRWIFIGLAGGHAPDLDFILNLIQPPSR